MTTPPASWVGLDLDDGRYHAAAALGEGGMAYIYRAFDRKKQRDVVLKVPKPALLADPEFVHRFAREVKTLVELRHPSIVAVLGFGRHLGLPFAVLEYMPGGTLDDRTKPCQPHELTEWLPDISAALDHIHANGYVHRDVKPSNILFDAKGRARLSDFGVVKSIDEKAGQTRALTETGVAVGTPEYMAPELARGESFDGNVDQYALAVTVYEMLAGRRPIDGGSGPVILVKQIQETPMALDELDDAIPGPLAAAVGRGLAKDERKRFDSCNEFAQVVSSAVADRPMRTRATLAHSDNQQTSPRFNLKWLLASLAFGFLVLVGVLVAMVRPPIDERDARVSVYRPDLPAQPGEPSHNFSIQATDETCYIGKTSNVTIKLDRIGSWHGTVQVQLVEPPVDCQFKQLTAKIPTDSNQCQFEFRPRRALNNVTVKFVAIGDQSKPQETTVNITAKQPAFTVTTPDNLDLAPGESRFVSVFLNREGFDEAIELLLRVPGGVRAEPNNLRFEAGVNEASVKLTALAAGKANTPIRLMHNGLEKARFDVRVVATSITPATPNRLPKAIDGVGQLVTREPGQVNVLAFHPKDDTTLAIWTERGWVNVWDLEAKSRRGGQHLSTPGMRGTFSADGRQIVTCGSNLVHLMTSRGETVSQGPSSHRILGVYYEGQFPNFWTTSGVCNYLGKLVRPGSPGTGVQKIKYGTAGATHSVRDGDGKIQWRSTSATQNWDGLGLVDDFAISHDGRWVAIAAKGKVTVYDTSKAAVPTEVWSKDIANVAAIAISPSGQKLAVGLANGEVRIVTVESTP